MGSKYVGTYSKIVSYADDVCVLGVPKKVHMKKKKIVPCLRL
jgi:hypothetical protein